MPKHLRVITILIAGAVAVTLLSAAGCEKSVSVTTDGTTTTTTTSDGETTTMTTTSEWWTDDTDRGDIPDEHITGVINDQEVKITDIQITDMDGEYDWSFSTGLPDDTCGVVIGDDAVNFSSKELQEGTFEKLMDEEIEFDDYHSYYHYDQGEDQGPMSVNVDWEAKVIVKEIDEDTDTVSGWARFDFSDGHTRLEGSFTADLCEW